jgi:hypothetical protein
VDNVHSGQVGAYPLSLADSEIIDSNSLFGHAVGTASLSSCSFAIHFPSWSSLKITHDKNLDIISNVFFSVQPTGQSTGSRCHIMREKPPPTYVLRRKVAHIDVTLMIPLRRYRRAGAGATIDSHSHTISPVFPFRKGGTRPSK